jgi:hypothetical protein
VVRRAAEPYRAAGHHDHGQQQPGRRHCRSSRSLALR